jgi:hypothetical protein
MQFVKTGEEPSPQYTPPPFPTAEFPEIVQLVRVGEDSTQHTPPPSLAEFPEIVQLARVGEQPSPAQNTPPP